MFKFIAAKILKLSRLTYFRADTESLAEGETKGRTKRHAEGELIN